MKEDIEETSAMIPYLGEMAVVAVIKNDICNIYVKRGADYYRFSSTK